MMSTNNGDNSGSEDSDDDENGSEKSDKTSEKEDTESEKDDTASGKDGSASEKDDTASGNDGSGSEKDGTASETDNSANNYTENSNDNSPPSNKDYILKLMKKYCKEGVDDATLCVSLNCEEAAVGYDPQAIVRHYVYRCRDDQFKRRRTPSIPTLRAEPAAHQYDDVVGFQTRPPPPQMVHPPPQMVHPPPQMVHPPPQMGHPPPQMVHPPPQMVHPPPQMAHPPPQTFQPPPPGVETTTLPQTLPSLSAIESLNISVDFPNPLPGAQLPLSTVLGQHMQAG
ncbi:WW domain-binding protein 11-like, partial [Frankliniella occidentalis]|uniref:WW domain-binding protein 11-like n=1 Tax=Frankliniella occidentalis TaxID=133901 RepID=A0A9C6XAH1_FRAOC